MILSESQILTLLKKPLNGDAIVKGTSLEADHKVHVTGEGYERLVKQVEGFEGKNDFNIRMQVSKPATMQITSIIIDNLNRWVNAQGTVKKADFRDSKKNKEYEEILDQVWNGNSFDYFIKTFYKEAIYTDFNGFALATKPKLIENIVDKEGVISQYNGEPLKPYIIFISIKDVYDYKLTGDKVEYLIIKLGDKEFRLIDDAKDVIINYSNNKINSYEAIENEIGYVPARKITNINNNLLNSQVKTSPISHIIPALNRYFSSDSDLRIQFIKHAYPKLAIVTKECKTCNGQGHVYDMINGDMDINTKKTCNTCDGTGREIPISRDGVLGLPQYLTQGDTPYPGTPASYINPEVESLRICIEDLEKQRKDILYSGTGDKGLISENITEETATSTIVSSRSLEDRIAEISAMVEDFEIFMKTALKDMYTGLQSSTDFTITVKYGRRIAVKGENELIEEIKAAKLAGLPGSFIQSLQRDMIYSKYKNNQSELERQLILADVEPFCGFTVDELMKFTGMVDKEDLYLKVNFDSLVDQFEEDYIIQDFMAGDDYKKRVNAIKTKLKEYVLQTTGRGSLMDGTEIMGTPEKDAPGI